MFFSVSKFCREEKGPRVVKYTNIYRTSAEKKWINRQFPVSIPLREEKIIDHNKA